MRRLWIILALGWALWQCGCRCCEPYAPYSTAPPCYPTSYYQPAPAPAAYYPQPCQACAPQPCQTYTVPSCQAYAPQAARVVSQPPPVCSAPASVPPTLQGR